jgi:aryl-alcohol dehydrogenase-like predicted oxidoreductase
MAAKIGVSVYAEDKIHELISRYPIDLIQAPVSILDQRLVQNGFLKRCRSLGIEIHARSVFLQGVLCMDPEQLPDYFRPYQAQIRKLRSYLSEHGVNPIEAALSFVNEMKEIDTFVCGVNNREQLQQLVYSLRRSNRELDFAPFAVSDPALLNPSQWIIHN